MVTPKDATDEAAAMVRAARKAQANANRVNNAHIRLLRARRLVIDRNAKILFSKHHKGNKFDSEANRQYFSELMSLYNHYNASIQRLKPPGSESEAEWQSP